ncbi:MAG: ribosomal-processing cysteine protease Prp, partial [Oscillospiraceae bacterium]
GFNDYGFDVCCASVTSAVQLTANAITEILKVKASVGAFENEIKLTLPDVSCKSAMSFIQALRLQLELLANDYEGNIRVSDTEL